VSCSPSQAWMQSAWNQWEQGRKVTVPPVGTVSMQILQSAVPESPASSSVIALVGSDLMAASEAGPGAFPL
jgi:hypothetical protein